MSEWRRSGGRPGRLRARAIWFALKYGLLPWWMYESECHYQAEGVGGYLPHLRVNLAQARRWAMFAETAADVAFEREANDDLPLIGDVRWRR
ncbi:MAG: hypothetical protein JSU06_00520 [Actinobacteria bacterium]|nr:hypothetical protein [Actinomycetota bacterium]